MPGSLGLPIVDHPEDPSLTEGAEAAEGYVATVLGLRGWPGRAESGSVARSIAILADVVRDVPGARLHLTHVSTAASLAQVRAAKAAGLPVTCDVTPHHLALTDQWIAGSRRWSWDAVDDDGRALDPWADGALDGGAVRPVAARQPAARAPAEDAIACLAALRDGTADAIATDHAPHTEVDKHVEFGWAATGSAASRPRSASCWPRWTPGVLPLARAIEALTTGPAAVLGRHGGPATAPSATASPRTSWSSTAGRRGASSPGRSGRRARTRRCSGASSRRRAADDRGGRVAYVR